MSLFDLFFRKPDFRKFQDCYALNRPSLWTGLHAAIRQRLLARHVVLLVAHFPDTFTQLQSELENWEIDYSIGTKPLDEQFFEQLDFHSQDQVHLLLAESICEIAPNGRPANRQPEIAMMVCERHPLPQRDQLIERFGRNLALPVQLGYFLSLDDDLVRRVVNDTTIQLMQQLGLDDHELITSHMVTRRMNIVLDRMASQVDSEKPADSAKEWLELNIPAGG